VEGVRPSAFAHGLRYAVLVPMSLTDRAVGVLAFWSPDRVFSRADEELLATIAALSALRLGR
jgi:hypothetical protein